MAMLFLSPRGYQSMKIFYQFHPIWEIFTIQHHPNSPVTGDQQPWRFPVVFFEMWITKWFPGIWDEPFSTIPEPILGLETTSQLRQIWQVRWLHFLVRWIPPNSRHSNPTHTQSRSHTTSSTPRGWDALTVLISSSSKCGWANFSRWRWSGESSWARSSPWQVRDEWMEWFNKTRVCYVEARDHVKVHSFKNQWRMDFPYNWEDVPVTLGWFWVSLRWLNYLLWHL